VITREGLDWLRDKLIKAGRFDAIKLEGIKEERRPSLPAACRCCARCSTCWASIRMQYAYGALRHGALYDMLDREQAADRRARDRRRALAAKFSADAAQAERVSRAALACSISWRPHAEKKAARGVEARDRLGRAPARNRLAHLARRRAQARRLHPGQRRRHPASPCTSCTTQPAGAGPPRQAAQAGSALWTALFMRQLLALRLAVILCHARRDPDRNTSISADAEPARGFTLSVGNGWAERLAAFARRTCCARKSFSTRGRTAATPAWGPYAG
jgi:exopolyphosphatase/guanosine-5'-triphosphate,3'-diphosphate pyrophosphatase